MSLQSLGEKDIRPHDWSILNPYSTTVLLTSPRSLRPSLIKQLISNDRKMAQNVNPYFEQQSSSVKHNDDSKKYSSDNHAVTKRLHKELMTLMMSQDKSISAFPEGENLFKWIGTISGPKDTVYENQKYKLSLQFPNSYPYTAPVVKFVTACFHPNVDTTGNICLDILKDKWSALYDVRTILLSIQALLGEPNIDSPLNALAAELWKNTDEYRKHVNETYKEV